MPPPWSATSFSKRSFTSRGSVSAPQKQAVRHDRSTPCSESSRVSASKSVGTPTRMFGRSVRSRWATIWALNWGTRIDLPPAMNAAFTHTPRPKPWKSGSAAEHRVALAQRAPGAGRLSLGDEVAVREQDALGQAGRAAGEEDRGGIVRARGGLGSRGRARGRHVRPPAHARVLGDLRDLAALGEPEAQLLHERQVVRDAGEDDRLQRRLGPGRRERTVEGVERERHARAGRVEEVRDLGRRRERVDHGRQRAHARSRRRTRSRPPATSASR